MQSHSDHCGNHHEAQMTKAKQEIERLQRGRQLVLKQIRKGYITQADADIEFTAINKEQEHWEQELANLVELDTHQAIAWERFWGQLKSIDKLYNWNFMTTTPRQKRELLSLILDSYILYKDSRIELRFKMPIDDKQVVDTIQDLSCNNAISICGVQNGFEVSHTVLLKSNSWYIKLRNNPQTPTRRWVS